MRRFVVRDHGGQTLAYVYFDNPRAATKPLTRDEARRIAVNIAKAARSSQRLAIKLWCLRYRSAGPAFDDP
jgi:hypothetical protein